jgi:hypothetical protein
MASTVVQASTTELDLAKAVSTMAARVRGPTPMASTVAQASTTERVPLIVRPVTIRGQALVAAGQEPTVRELPALRDLLCKRTRQTSNLPRQGRLISAKAQAVSWRSQMPPRETYS